MDIKDYSIVKLVCWINFTWTESY